MVMNHYTLRNDLCQKYLHIESHNFCVHTFVLFVSMSLSRGFHEEQHVQVTLGPAEPWGVHAQVTGGGAFG